MSATAAECFRETKRERDCREREAVRDAAKSAAKKLAADFRRHGVHSVYVIEGPSGVYVGCSGQPAKREAAHRAQGRSRSARLDQPIHVVMRRDGADQYVFRVVASSRGNGDALETEYEVVQQMRDQGYRVLNVMPRTSLHTAPIEGKVDYVVHNGERQAL